MLTALRKRLTKDEDGFTLIELMVVVLIIAILIAIAIPTFLGAQNRARDRGAQSDLRNAVMAAKTIATDNAGVFVTQANVAISETAMATAEPSLSFVDGAPSAAGVIDVVTPSATDGSSIVLYNKSASGTFFCIAATSTGAVTYGKGATAASVNTLAQCNQPKW